MNQETLDSFVGLNVAEAKKEVVKAGYTPEVFPINAIITLQARPKTVLLWHKHGEVMNATAGDPLELE